MEIEWRRQLCGVSRRLCGRARQKGNGLGQESIVEDVLRKLRMEFCSGLRRREAEHAVRREGFGLEKGVSWGRSEQRWRTKFGFLQRQATTAPLPHA